MSTPVGAGPDARLRPATVFLAFAAFGLLWGLYAAALPEIRRSSGASDAEFGIALLCVGLAAAPAMFLIGRLLDRLGRPIAVAAAVLFAIVAPLPALVGSVPQLVVTLLLFGFSSGAYDVVINSLAATMEAELDVRVMNRAHALFSVGLLVGSIGTSAALTAGVAAWVPLAVFSVMVVLSVLAAAGSVPRRFGQQQRQAIRRKRRIDRVVVGFGLLAALAMLVESGVQQWSAVFLEEVVHAPPGLSGLAPGVFAGSMALGRVGGHWVSTRMSDRLVLLLSGVLSGAGVLLIAVSKNPVSALVGFAATGAAISVAAPTIYGLAGRRAAPGQRGATIGLASSVAYLGLLLGPAVVGQVAALADLRTAIGWLAVVSIAVSLAALRVPSASARPATALLR